MATFFGEVVVAPSRAGVDDEEESAEEAREETPEDREIRRELEKKREIDVLWTLKSGASADSSADEPFVCSKFIVAIGHNAAGRWCRLQQQTARDSEMLLFFCCWLNLRRQEVGRKSFLSSFILDSVCWEVVGVAKLWNEWCRTSNTTNVLPTDSFCLFYRLISDPTVLLCQCSCYVAEDQQFQWLEKVFGCMRKESLQVTILSTCPVADYKTQESTLTLPSPFLKALKTKEFKEQVCCPLLEQPNIVRDLPAAVLSYCQVWQIPAVLYECYTDVIKLDTVTIEAFKPLLSSKILKSLVKDVSESTKILKKLLTTNETHNNIYI
ncbi:proteasome assembly chaperone 1 isoform 1-T1 [Theristicus caerulescens]